MSRLCIAEIETHDPSGRIVTLYIHVDSETRKVTYEPTLSDGEVLGISHVFRVGTQLPSFIHRNEENEKIDEIESKIRFHYSKVRKIFTC